MRAYWSIACVCLSLGISSAFAESEIDVTLAFSSDTLPGALQVYSLAPEKKVPLWQTKVVSKLAEAPVGELIPDGRKRLKKGRAHRFVLVYENNTKLPVYFFAAPHGVLPAESSLGFKFKCLCVNHAFEVEPHGIWYRVVELRLSKGLVGDKMTITHTLVAIDKDRAAEFSHDLEWGDH